MTWEYLATTAGSVAATILITNALRAAFGLSAAWVALLVAFLTQAAVWWFVGGGTPEAAGLAVFNTFVINASVIYAAATGGNAIVNAVVETRHTTRATDGASFWAGWV